MAEGFSPSLLWLSITVTEEAVHNACAFAAADAVDRSRDRSWMIANNRPASPRPSVRQRARPRGSLPAAARWLPTAAAARCPSAAR
eukprot:5579049-Prymnesium_polylepis.1